jgi:glucose/arabinose dehydrogenase
VIARLLLLLAALLLPGGAGAQVQLKVPPGFHVDVFAADLGGVRLMVLDPAGTLLVSVPARGRVLALPDRNGDGKADATHVVMDRLNRPHGLALGGKAVLDPRVNQVARCEGLTPPTVEIQAHSAPIGLVFYTGTQFPAEYRGSLFVAYRGSWNRLVPTGYKVVRIRFQDGQPAGVEDFATGWLEGVSSWGRPVDVLVGRDGALYMSDQGAGRIYRIRYGS